MSRSTRRAAVPVVAVVAGLGLGTAIAPGVLPLGVVVQGAVFGATTGLLAVGLVLTYQATRIVNFAHGALGALGASVGVSLYMGPGWPWFAAVVAGVVVAAVTGVLVDALVVRRFESASRLTLTVATIGVAQAVGGLSLLVPGWLGAPLLIGAFDTGLSSTTLRLRPVLFTGNEMVMVLVVPVAVVGLGWFLGRTDAGVAVRAAAEHRDRARLLAVPVRRLSALVWATAAGLSALTLLLVAPGQGLQSNLGVTPIALLPALAAAVVAGMASLRVAFGTAVGLGIIDQLIRWHVHAKSVTTVVFLGVIVVALLLRRESLGRDEPGEASLGASTPAPRATRPVGDQLGRNLRTARWGGLAAGAGLLLLLPAVLPASDVYLFSTGVVYAMVAVSLVVLTGWGGQVSLGQFAFVGVGGVVAANLVLRFNLDLFWALAASGLAGALMAVVIGLPALRIRGAFLAVSTLAFAVAIDSYAFNPTNFASWLPFSVDRPELLHRIDLSSEVSFAYFALALLAVTIALVSGLRRGRPGRSVMAVRDNPRAAAAMAVPVTRTRLAAFVLAGTVAGVAGGLHVHLLGGISTSTYAPATSLVLFSMVVIGGIDSVPGAVVGVAAVQVLGRFYPDYQVMLTGVGMLLLLLVVPGGLAEVGRRTRDRVLRLLSGPSEGEGAGPPPAARLRAGVAGDGDGPAALLRCDGVEAAYGPLQVLFGIDLAVGQGEVVALLGTNGAGKSSVLRAITGLLPIGAGTITFDGQRLDGRPAEEIARSGIAMVPGGRGVFPGLTVGENLRVATWAFRRDGATVAERRAEVLDQFPALRERLDQTAGSLSGGEQQMLALAQAFVGRPRLLLIDELSIGLAPAVVADLLEAVRRRVADGVTVVLVEQSVNIALTIAERAVFLEKGEVRFSGPTVDLLDRPDVLRAVFLAGPTTAGAGGGGARTRPRAAPAAADPAEVVLACQGLSKRFGGIVAVDDVQLDVGAGRVLGLIGHNGAGKTTLFDLMSGFLVPDTGSVHLGEVDLTSLAPSERARLGLARSFQEARLFPSLDVRETLAVALDRHLHGRGDGFVAAALRLPPALDAERIVAERVTELVDQLGLGAYARTPIAHLSTGTRRIVELGCVLATSPRVLLLDEPTAGVAQRETEHLGPLLRQVQEETGCSMVIIEHDMPMLSGLCDQLVALDRGRVIARGLPADVLGHPQVIASYLGSEAATIARSGAR